MNSKAEALAAAKKRILELQSQMSDRILKMAAEVEKLTAIVSEREAREFLRVACNVASTELSTYVKFADTLKGSEETLRKARASFPVVKALVSAEPDTRTEILERIEIGARISTADITAIRKRLKDAGLTPEEVIAERNGKLTAAAARRKSAIAAADFQERLYDYVQDILPITDASELLDPGIRSKARGLRSEFEELFGVDHRSPGASKRNSKDRDLSSAYFALVHLDEGTLATAVDVEEWEEGDFHPWLISLLSLSGRPYDEQAFILPRARPLSRPLDRLKVVELCAGAGGMSLGLERAGFEHVGVFEIDPDAAATLRANRPDWPVIEADIRTIPFTPYREIGIDLVAGGLACQPYSVEGHGLGKDDPRDLFPEAIRIVNEIKPKAFVFENVEGFLHGKHSDHVAAILRGFRKAGYQTEIHRIQAGDYGVAQVRRRVLVIGLRHDIADAFRMPPTFPGRRLNVGDALVDLMAANGWEGAHEWARHRSEQVVLDRNGEVVAYGAQASTIVTGSCKRRRNEQAVQQAMGYDTTGSPENAPTAEEASKPGFMPSLTMRMKAKLQDFDDDWQFSGGKVSKRRQIGNAVPPRLAQAVGMSIYSAIRGVEWDWEAALWPQERARQVVEAPPLVTELAAVTDDAEASMAVAHYS
ncbi:DNA cytosine methyltransferase [Agrobacterium tumefaciens]|uniref:DNA cytosine methyltransferase n=1 Tax=Agrobacterium tumefaciens TaxID=358 RepID=UPI003BA36BCD